MGLFDKLQSMMKSDRVDISERFELMRKAISGTMSKFYMARDLKYDKLVGLKIADQDKVSVFEGRFKGLNKPSEGEIASQLNHPRVVATHEFGRTTENIQYIVMEFLDGPGLHMLLNQQAVEIEGKRLKLIRQMAEALEYVHQSGYIHRDVCPRNFIYLPKEESIKLIDFGLTLPDKSAFRQPGNRTGTPLYMAPEVLRRRWTDHRLDIFAMGVSAYQICSYQLPWPVGDATGQAALAHDTQAPTDILTYRPTLNPTLAKAIMRCIEPDAKDRPPSAEQFLKMIRRVDDDDA